MKWTKSLELFECSKRSLAGGVSSNARLEELEAPLFFTRGEGSRLYDVDGNEYIDYNMGRGPTIFGHSPGFLLEAVAKAVRRGQTFGAQHELEISVSEMVQQAVPCAELVRYASSGTEVVQVALRVARAYTGRSKFVKFEGHFHGWVDSVAYGPPTSSSLTAADIESSTPVPMSAGVAPSTADDIVLLPFNDIDMLRDALDRHHNQVAAVLVEMSSLSMLPELGYIREVRRLCDERGIVLVFDEVVTGFRVALGGAQEVLAVTPDLATFAKAMAGGFPVGMLAGRRDIMTLIGDGTVMHGGTLNSNVMSMAAAEASLERLSENDGAVYRQLDATGQALMEGLRERASEHEIDLLVQGPGPFFDVTFTDATEIRDYRSYLEARDPEKAKNFWLGMMERGVRPMADGAFFVSTAHTDEDVEQTLAAANEVFATL